jgi:hypothetical protein
VLPQGAVRPASLGVLPSAGKQVPRGIATAPGDATAGESRTGRWLADGATDRAGCLCRQAGAAVVCCCSHSLNAIASNANREGRCMLGRRMFASCAICAAIGLVADDASAETSSGLKRTIAARHDGPTEGYETLEVIADIEPSFVVEWHIHPEHRGGLHGGGRRRISHQGRDDDDDQAWLDLGDRAGKSAHIQERPAPDQAGACLHGREGQAAGDHGASAYLSCHAR